jgi:hypothetical protein
VEVEKEKREQTGSIQMNNRLSEADGPKLFGPAHHRFSRELRKVDSDIRSHWLGLNFSRTPMLYSVPWRAHDLDAIAFRFWVYRVSAVRMLNPDPLWVWLPTGALVRINVVPGSISARTFCKKDGSMEIRSSSSFKFGAFLPTLAV